MMAKEAKQIADKVVGQTKSKAFSLADQELHKLMPKIKRAAQLGSYEYAQIWHQEFFDEAKVNIVYFEMEMGQLLTDMGYRVSIKELSGSQGGILLYMTINWRD